MKPFLTLLIGLSVILTGCRSELPIPNNEQLHLTATYITGNIYATQAKLAPTPTVTLKPTNTVAPTIIPIYDAIVTVPLLKAFSEPKITNNHLFQFSSGDGLLVNGRNRDCSWIEVSTPLGDLVWINTQLERVSFITPCEFLPHSVIRPKNGEYIFDKRTSKGKGELLIDNGLNQDGYIVLTDSDNKPIIGCYIHSNETTKILQIPDGTYFVYFSIGNQWDIVEYRFIVDAVYQKFDDILKFTSFRSTSSSWRITLHPVEGGKAATDVITFDDFPSLND